MTLVTAPITISHDAAREQLVREGEVVTFRPEKRTTGATWWRATRLGETCGDCEVTSLGPVNSTSDAALREHVGLSGFESLDAWRSAIRALHHGALPESGHLYRVTTAETTAEHEPEVAANV